MLLHVFILDCAMDQKLICHSNHARLISGYNDLARFDWNKNDSLSELVFRNIQFISTVSKNR